MKKKTTTGKVRRSECPNVIREFHLFAGIGGGIYGGKLLRHQCVGAVEIMPYARNVLAQRKKDGWMDKSMDIDSHTDITTLNGADIRGAFDVLCGGFPCQAFSTAAHGKNIAEKNLWDHMFRVAQESDAPIVFGENVVLRAIEKAKADLESVGYQVERVRLSCSDIGADHQRNRYWLLAVKDWKVFAKLAAHLASLPKLTGDYWHRSMQEAGAAVEVKRSDRRDQLLGVGNAQSPFAAATAFRILVNRHLNHDDGRSELVSDEELGSVFEKRRTWIDRTYRDTGIITGLVHTPTTMANYACPSMMKHEGCRNFTEVFGRPEPMNAEYLMGFPLGASSPNPQSMTNIERWGEVK
ncbi:MAG: DNA cytosine methyltransferase [Kiritimatiellae bacterium]|nr:DNA cytosine methyltransferase [Kiritimatiellia bacterium]